MKALLIKDWKLMVSQKRFFLMMGIIMAMFLLTLDDPSFVISYATIMSVMFATGTVSYDEYQNGMPYLLTLPISRKEYVAEKYVLSLLLAVSTAVAVMVLAAVALTVRGKALMAEEILLAEMSVLVVAAVFLSIGMPVQLKFGSERGKLAVAALFAMIIILISLGAKAARMLGWQPQRLLEGLEEVPVPAVLAAFAAVSLAFLLISAAVSVSILEKKEF